MSDTAFTLSSPPYTSLLPFSYYHLSLLHLCVQLWHLDVHYVSEMALGEVGDSELANLQMRPMCYLAGLVIIDPFVRLGVFH